MWCSLIQILFPIWYQANQNAQYIYLLIYVLFKLMVRYVEAMPCMSHESLAENSSRVGKSPHQHPKNFFHLHFWNLQSVSNVFHVPIIRFGLKGLFIYLFILTFVYFTSLREQDKAYINPSRWSMLSGPEPAYIRM